VTFQFLRPLRLGRVLAIPTLRQNEEPRHEVALYDSTLYTKSQRVSFPEFFDLNSTDYY